MIGPWDRVEGSSRDDELDSGVEARVADPLWLLARQWQVGEFRGDDAGSPAVAHIGWESVPLRSYRAGVDPAASARPMPTATPLERVVEAAPPPTTAAGGRYWTVRLAGQLSRRLVRRGLTDAVALLRGEFALSADASEVALPGPGTAATELGQRHSFDGAAALADEARVAAALAPLPERDRTRAIDVIEGWRADLRARFGPAASDAWDRRRLEHRFSLTAGTGSPDEDVVLTADEYGGGHLDWYSFDVESGATTATQDTEKPARTPGSDRVEDDAPERPRRRGRDGSAVSQGAGRGEGQAGGGTDRLRDGRDAKTPGGTVSVVPTPVRYAGMPAPRWWAFEEGQTHFGDIAAAPGDLARLLLADFATVYGNDWFSVPLRLPIGTLARISSARVFDTMGRRVDVPPAAALDDRSPRRRGFRLYELSGDPSVEQGLAPLLFVPPSLSGSEIGPALDRVDFVRDESANVVWAVERLVEGPLGRPVDRLQHWRTASGNDSPKPKGSKPAAGAAEADGATAATSVWRYRLQATAPPFWIPFVPVRIGGSAQVRLRRARMQAWDLLDRRTVGARSSLLQPDRPMAIEEEEVPQGGMSVERRWQAARWIDGSLHVWLQRSKRAGATERSAGLAWDHLEDPAGG